MSYSGLECGVDGYMNLGVLAVTECTVAVLKSFSVSRCLFRNGLSLSLEINIS